MSSVVKRRKSYWRAFASALWPLAVLFVALFGFALIVVLAVARAKTHKEVKA